MTRTTSYQAMGADREPSYCPVLHEFSSPIRRYARPCSRRLILSLVRRLRLFVCDCGTSIFSVRVGSRATVCIVCSLVSTARFGHRLVRARAFTHAHRCVFRLGRCCFRPCAFRFYLYGATSAWYPARVDTGHCHFLCWCLARITAVPLHAAALSRFNQCLTMQ